MRVLETAETHTFDLTSCSNVIWLRMFESIMSPPAAAPPPLRPSLQQTAHRVEQTVPLIIPTRGSVALIVTRPISHVRRTHHLPRVGAYPPRRAWAPRCTFACRTHNRRFAIAPSKSRHHHQLSPSSLPRPPSAIATAGYHHLTAIGTQFVDRKIVSG